MSKSLHNTATLKDTSLKTSFCKWKSRNCRKAFITLKGKVFNCVYIRHYIVVKTDFETDLWHFDKSPGSYKSYIAASKYNMFVLAQMKDTVRIPPNLFHLDTTQAIIEILNKKFANKVVHNVGLCIVLWDIENFEDSFIFPGDGGTHTVVHFRYVIFRPFVDEVLLGKVKSCGREGINVSMGFFDDIFIPSDALQHPSKLHTFLTSDSNEQEQLWAWEYDTEDGKHDLYMDIGEEIRFRVMEEKFVDTTPQGPEGLSMEVGDLDPETRKSPYTIIGTVAEAGLGLLSWWTSAG